MNRTGKGVVVSIDIDENSRRPPHQRVIYLEGSSVELAPLVHDEIKKHEEEQGQKMSVMVSLDSDHRKTHVAKELEAFKDIVTEGQYMVVEDTNLNGHPVYPNWREIEGDDGPWEATAEFTDPRFRADTDIPRRHMFSMHTWLIKEAL
jgi:cephalosporin hydroxylase